MRVACSWRRALAAGAPGPYQVQAAIAALHDEAADAASTDWVQIAALYQALLRMTPSPVVELNLAVAVAMADGPAVGLAMMDGVAADGTLDELPLPPRGARRPAAPAGPLVGGGDGLRARAGAHDQRPGTGVPRAATGRGPRAGRRRTAPLTAGQDRPDPPGRLRQPAEPQRRQPRGRHDQDQRRRRERAP